MNKDKDKVDFGFKTVLAKDKYKLVKEVFDNVAGVYDQMNDLMSLGVHRLWKKEFTDIINNNHPNNLLDVGGGTGNIAFKCLKFNPNLGTVILDINKNMLLKGKERAYDLGYFDKIKWLVGNAEQLPIKDNMFDAYSIAFCIRNVTYINKVLEEAYRVLRKGGRFYCLEFSHVNNEALSKIYEVWSFRVIPKIGKLVAKNQQPYDYLVESIKKFPKKEEFSKMVELAGFTSVSAKLLSFGIACIHTGIKK